MCRAVTAGWIRVGGILAALFGFYYLGVGWAERQEMHNHSSISPAVGFYVSTILGRAFLCAAFCVLVLSGQVGRTLLLPAAVNLLSALNMYVALQRRQSADSVTNGRQLWS